MKLNSKFILFSLLLVLATGCFKGYYLNPGSYRDNYIRVVGSNADFLIHPTGQYPTKNFERMEDVTYKPAYREVDNMDQAVEVANYIAPEHLELSLDKPQEMASKIRHAGAIFMGRYTAEVLGDYCAGPNHVLPTSRTARFSSPLGVYDFQKRSSLIMCSEQGAAQLGDVASVLARGEGLTAHARSAEFRMKKN